MRQMLRWWLRKNKDLNGFPSIGFGIKIGYWPCMKAPYVQIAVLFWNLQIWHGLPSKEQLADK